MKINSNTINKIEAIEKKNPVTWNRKQRRFIQSVSKIILGKLPNSETDNSTNQKEN